MFDLMFEWDLRESIADVVVGLRVLVNSLLQKDIYCREY
jgi:hypothetical protein